MVVGLAFTAAYIIAERFVGVDLKSMLGDYHIAPEGVGTIGCLLNFTVALVVSRMTSVPDQKLQQIVDDLRVPEV